MTESRSLSVSPNRILSRLSRRDLRLLEGHLETAVLPARKRLEIRNRRIDHVYFIEEGIASVVAGGTGGDGIEVGIIGNEGMTGLAVVLGADRSPLDTFMHTSGVAQCMRAANLRLRMNESASLRAALTQHAFAFHIQMSQTALANGRGTLETRLARRLLMAGDRLDSDRVEVTHESLAYVLGVRRPGVTLALKRLEDGGYIEAERGAIRIVNRGGLEHCSDGTYGGAEAEYNRLFAYT